MFTMKVETDNDAFRHDDCARAELVRILQRVAGAIDAGDVDGTVRDINGNTCGEWNYDLGDPDADGIREVYVLDQQGATFVWDWPDAGPVDTRADAYAELKIALFAARFAAYTLSATS